MGLVAAIIAIIIGVNIVRKNTPESMDNTAPASSAQTAQVESILDYPQPTGKILLISEFPVTSNPELGRVASNLVAQLGAAGWDVTYDSEQEARVRSWLPAEPEASPVLAQRLEDEQLAGVLLLDEGDEGTLLTRLIEFENTNTFRIEGLVGE